MKFGGDLSSWYTIDVIAVNLSPLSDFLQHFLPPWSPPFLFFGQKPNFLFFQISRTIFKTTHWEDRERRKAMRICFVMLGPVPLRTEDFPLCRVPHGCHCQCSAAPIFQPSTAWGLEQEKLEKRKTSKTTLPLFPTLNSLFLIFRSKRVFLKKLFFCALDLHL